MLTAHSSARTTKTNRLDAAAIRSLTIMTIPLFDHGIGLDPTGAKKGQTGSISMDSLWR
jgi:hypothetical protein